MRTQSHTSLHNVPIEITISVGRARPSIGELLELKTNSILSLDKKIEDPVELFIGDRLIARGQLEESEGATGGQLVVRLTEISDFQTGAE